MLGVGTSIWNRALAGKGDGSGGNPPAGVTPIHSIDLTAAPSASNAFDDYGLALPRTVTDYSGRIVQIPADAVPMGGLRPVRNLWPTADGSDTPSTQAITVESGRVYQLRIGAESASGATAVCSGAFTGTLTGDGADIQAFDTGKTATTTSLTVTITGSIRKLQLQDITHRADLSTAPDEFVSTDDDYGTGVNGFRYFDTELDNTVDGSGVVNEGTGASIDGWLDYQPGDTNYADCTHDFSGGADTITLTATGYYTLWLEGTAQVTIAAGTATITGAGAATEGSPVTINCTATGTVTLTLDNGTLDEWGAYQIIQLSDGTVPTAFIPSTGSATRPAMSPAPTISGLVGTEDARLTVKGLGPNLITNGGFDTDSDWSKGTGWSISDGKASANLSSWVNLLQFVTIDGDTPYLLIFDITERTAGSVNPYIGGALAASGLNTVNTHVVFIATPSGVSNHFYFRSGDFVGSIDNVQLHKVDPTDDTERTIDLNNVAGEFDMFNSIPIKVLSIDVYNDGERPD